MTYIKHFSEIGMKDLEQVGGKNAFLGEMVNSLSPKGILVPDGFAVTANAYWFFLDHNQLLPELKSHLAKLDSKTFSNLSSVGKKIRELFLKANFPEELEKEIIRGVKNLNKRSGRVNSMAVRSSATAEDLPTASFAGQQESFLNVQGEINMKKACQRCYASLFTDRAIKYRVDNGFDHLKVALSIGIQNMIRSDLASSGVMFTLDPDSGFENVILISSGWGLGENIVQGNINTDEFLVFKPLMEEVAQPVISHSLGTKLKTMIYSSNKVNEIQEPEDALVNMDTPPDQQKRFSLKDPEIIRLAKWARIIELHYNGHTDIEWAKDGEDNEIYIVQAKPVTVHRKTKSTVYKKYTLLDQKQPICEGVGIGNKIVSGKARRLKSPTQIAKLKEGEILVTERTDPDWDPVFKKAAAIITDQGGRTSHAAIVARELSVTAVIGTSNGTKLIKDGQKITVSTANGNGGLVYDGLLKWEERETQLDKTPTTKTKMMLILAHPDEAFRYSFLPNDGVGLLRLEFIISSTIGIHPLALKHFEKITNKKIKKKIEEQTKEFGSKEEYFIRKLAEGTAKIAAAFHPKEVVVRMSDFKSNEYANLIGGKIYEPKEENPMIGFRGAARYYGPLYKDAFKMECAAMKMVRNEMGLRNVKLMIPFCRTIEEAKKVIAVMEEGGLKRKEKDLKILLMIEVPANALMAEEFSKYFDGFSIGSNDLTQLALGVDRDSELLSALFDSYDPAVMRLLEMTLEKAKKAGIPTGFCGQAPGDYPEYASFLIKNGIDSISFNPDALLKGIGTVAEAEKMIKPKVKIP